MSAQPPAVVAGARTVIRCQNLGKRFGRRWVLRHVDLEIRTGEVLGIIGPGGHGKSVLLRCLAGLYTADEGRVLIEGEALALMGPDQLAATRERFGYLFQNYALFDFMTVLDNVAFPARQLPGADGREDAIVAAASARLEEVGLGHALDRYPRELSGGMKKRVGLARATITDPQIGLYDDPSAGLDPVTSSKIFDLVARMHALVPSCASVVVSHDIDRLKPLCDRYVMLLHGQVVFDGTDADIPTADPRVQRFFEVALTKHLAVS